MGIDEDKKPETFADTVDRLSQNRDEYDLAAVEAAQERYQEDGAIEIDDNALTSRGDDADGCYVLAWVWVERDNMTLEGEEKVEKEDEGE